LAALFNAITLLIMLYLIRITLVLISTFFFADSYSQVIIDPAISKKYNSAIKKRSKEIQKNGKQADNLQDYSEGVVIFTSYQADTLNRFELKQIQGSDVVLIDIDPKTGKPIKSKRKQSTEVIEIGYPFASQNITHSIFNRHVTTVYKEHYKYDSLVKVNASDSFTNEITLNGENISFTLSDSSLSTGKFIYGYAEIIMEPYYLKDSWVENQFFILRWKLKYYFKFRVIKKL
jgi:hypothetical protein